MQPTNLRMGDGGASELRQRRALQQQGDVGKSRTVEKTAQSAPRDKAEAFRTSGGIQKGASVTAQTSRMQQRVAQGVDDTDSDEAESSWCSCCDCFAGLFSWGSKTQAQEDTQRSTNFQMAPPMMLRMGDDEESRPAGSMNRLSASAVRREDSGDDEELALPPKGSRLAMSSRDAQPASSSRDSQQSGSSRQAMSSRGQPEPEDDGPSLEQITQHLEGAKLNHRGKGNYDTLASAIVGSPYKDGADLQVQCKAKLAECAQLIKDLQHLEQSLKLKPSEQKFIQVLMGRLIETAHNFEKHLTTGSFLDMNKADHAKRLSANLDQINSTIQEIQALKKHKQPELTVNSLRSLAQQWPRITSNKLIPNVSSDLSEIHEVKATKAYITALGQAPFTAIPGASKLQAKLQAHYDEMMDMKSRAGSIARFLEDTPKKQAEIRGFLREFEVMAQFIACGNVHVSEASRDVYAPRTDIDLILNNGIQDIFVQVKSGTASSDHHADETNAQLLKTIQHAQAAGALTVLMVDERKVSREVLAFAKENGVPVFDIDTMFQLPRQ